MSVTDTTHHRKLVAKIDQLAADVISPLQATCATTGQMIDRLSAMANPSAEAAAKLEAMRSLDQDLKALHEGLERLNQLYLTELKDLEAGEAVVSKPPSAG